MSRTQNTKALDKLRKDMGLAAYSFIDVYSWMQKAYEAGRSDEREHCKKIAARVRKELDR